MSEYLNAYGWQLQSDIVTTKPVKGNVDTFDLKEDLDFLNRMTVQLENVAKANAVLKSGD